MKTDVLVVGGSAAGIMAAMTAKKHYPEKDVLLVRKESKVLIPCGIPYTMATVDGPENNLIPDAVLTGNGIDFLVDEVTSVDRDNKTAVLKSDQEISYDKMILATGCKPFIPPIKGVELDGIYSVEKDYDLLKDIRERLDTCKDSCRNLVIIGGGFIGVEFADECRKGRDINVTIVELMDRVLSLVCDDDICVKAEQRLRENGGRKSRKG